MLSLHLEKSEVLLQGRLRFVRYSLVGQKPPRAPRLKISPQAKRALLAKATAVTHKYQVEPSRPDVVPAQPDLTSKKVFSFPEIQRTAPPDELPQVFTPVVKPGRSLRTTLFTVFMGLSFSLLLVLFAPIFYFRFFTHEVVPVATQDAGTVLGGEFKPPAQPTRQIAQPPLDENLPEGNWLIIPKIGVNTEILESENSEESLIKGVWHAPESGKPGDITQPMILAAHRYGYNWWWKGTYWKYHSFYLLPELQPGDLVEVISGQRKYLYEIYAGEEGTEITDYNGDLILYTCKFLTSDIRHFRYARLIDPSKYGDYEKPQAATGSAQTAK